MNGMPDVLVRLVREAAEQTAAARAVMAFDAVERAAAVAPPARDFAGALRGGAGLRVIAEVKQRTPSRGELVAPGDYRPAELARAYVAGGAAAISVLTHAAGFGGSVEHLRAVRAAVDVPVLRKDFVTTEYQVAEARAAGADSVLLIAAALSGDRLRALVEYARGLGMEPLVELHEQAELAPALTAGARVLGVNHRDLRTFAVDTSLTGRFRPLVPAALPLVAESGIKGAQGARAMREAGADAILVGEALMRAADPAAAVRELAAA